MYLCLISYQLIFKPQNHIPEQADIKAYVFVENMHLLSEFTKKTSLPFLPNFSYYTTRSKC